MTDQFHAWNPGLGSDIPRHLLPLVTLFREENGFVSYREAKELSDLTGLKLNELVAFRPQRLVVHTLLVRVTADLSVPDGPNYEELGLNLRGMVETIHHQYVLPEIDAICELFDSEKERVRDFISQQLSEQLSDRSKQDEKPAQAPSLLARLLGKKKPVDQPVPSQESLALEAIDHWRLQFTNDSRNMQDVCYRALVKIVGSIVGHRGALRIDQELVARIATNMVCNRYVAQVVDEFIAPLFDRAVEVEGYRLLPAQQKPVIMNVKGASASGKSTIRPQQRELAGKLNIPWEDFALISPDYWRKYLLEYQSLGEDYKYGAMLTGTELETIDKKLDRYMELKASSGEMSHLLIDRFRFDSFTVDIDRAADSKLLSRFGDQVYLFFVVTPPAETVTRAWLRGIETGRYKAVDDLLYHNVEAFTGMPALFLSWINSKDRKVHFEFLDNDVPLGELPRTAAFGWNGTMTVLDVQLMQNIDRYRQVDITAQQADDILKSDPAKESAYTDFIKQCSQTVSHLDFADRDTLQIYACIRDGSLIWWDDDYISRHKDNVSLQQTLAALGFPNQQCEAQQNQPDPIDKASEEQYLVGQ
ncbi:MAG: hypothetical protein AB8B79_23560 [Granulosicoccus sp.]